MSLTAIAPTPDLAPEIIAALRPDSIVTHAHDDLRDGKEVWTVVVDDKIVAHFGDGEDHENEQDAEQLRAQIQKYVGRLASRAELVAGLRDLADFLEAHPEIPDPHVWGWLNSYSGGTEALRQACDALRPRGFETKIDGTRVKVTSHFGPVQFEIEADADKVCEERVETREVRETVVPDWAQPPTPPGGRREGDR